jgi:hypothetical protein
MKKLVGAGASPSKVGMAITTVVQEVSGVLCRAKYREPLVQHKRWWLDGASDARQNSVCRAGRFITVYTYIQ